MHWPLIVHLTCLAALLPAPAAARQPNPANHADPPASSESAATVTVAVKSSPSADSRAEEDDSAATEPNKTSTTNDAGGTATVKEVPKADLDFDLLGPSSSTAAPDPAAAARIAEQARKRRTLLRWHQGVGIGMLATMVLTTVLGQLNYYDLYGGGSGSGNYIWPHRVGAMLTTLSFAATGALALAAPEPYEKTTKGIDSALVHKVSMAAAAAGMVTQVVLGFFTARKADAGSGDGLAAMARAHLGVGYATLGFASIGALSYVF